MRTSLIETAHIDHYLHQTGDMGERVLLEARLQIDPDLVEKVAIQTQTYTLIEAHGRTLIREAISRVDAEIFQHPKHALFRRSILSFFSKK